MISFYIAATDDDYAAAKSLFKAYVAALNIDLAFQHFDEELEDLKNMYGRPSGGIILAKDEYEIIGCVAIRKINTQVGELKRMYIRPGYQQKGIGKNLLQLAMDLAKECNYNMVKLDTLNYMHAAIHLYKQAGFYETPPYYHNPINTALYFEKIL